MKGYPVCMCILLPTSPAHRLPSHSPTVFSDIGQLDLEDNQLTGTIPESLSALTGIVCVLMPAPNLLSLHPCEQRACECRERASPPYIPCCRDTCVFKVVHVRPVPTGG